MPNVITPPPKDRRFYNSKMSGRSAIVRARRGGDNNSSPGTLEYRIKIVPAATYPPLEKQLPPSPSPLKHVFQDPHVSVQQPTRLISSAIEKSNARAHVDEVTDHVRNNLGKWMGLNKNKLRGKRSLTSLSSPSSTVIPTPSLMTGSTTPTLRQSSEMDISRRSSLSLGPALSLKIIPEVTKPTIIRRPSISPPRASDIHVFSGAGSSCSVQTLTTLIPFSSSCDTVVFLRGKHQTMRPYQTFCVDSSVLDCLGCVGFMSKLSPLDDSDPDYSLLRGLADSQAEGPPIDVSGIKHKMCLEVPAFDNQDQDVAYLLELRNMMAVLHGKTEVCASTLYNALSGVVNRLFNRAGFSIDEESRRKLVIDFVKNHKYDDVRNSYAQAQSMLAFCEMPEIRWTEGYLECFAHCAAMKHLGFPATNDWAHLSPQTQARLEKACAEMKERFDSAQESLAKLEFGDIWSPVISMKSCGRAAFVRFQSWLRSYLLENDPDLQTTVNRETWLTPRRLDFLNETFNALFDYLVDQDIISEKTSATSGPQWNLVSRSNKQVSPSENNMEVLFNSLIDSYDKAHSFPRMPHPYPLLPLSTEPLRRRGTLSSRKNSLERDREAVQLSYFKSSNFSREAHPAGSVIGKFAKFEREDEIFNVNPRDARMGRWMLIYGALQALASVTPVAPALKYTQNVSYHLSVSLNGVVPWTTLEHDPDYEPHHEDSYPFTAPSHWPPTSPVSTCSPGTTSFELPGFSDFNDNVIYVHKEVTVVERPKTQDRNPVVAADKSTETLVSAPMLPALRLGNIVSLVSGGNDRAGTHDPVSRGDPTGGTPVKIPGGGLSRMQKRPPGFTGGKSNYKPEAGW